MTVRTKRLGLYNGDANPGGVVFTCPTDRTAILKDVRAQNRDGVARDFILELDPSGATGATRIIFEAAVPATGWRQWTGLFVVLQEGDTLVLTFADATHFVASGTLLLGDPE